MGAYTSLVGVYGVVITIMLTIPENIRKKILENILTKGQNGHVVAYFDLVLVLGHNAVSLFFFFRQLCMSFAFPTNLTIV